MGATVADDKCLQCHKTIAARISAKAGYHASSEVSGKNCSSCHREHNGREYELVYWPKGEKAFDHALTGYPLEGAHRDRECRSCHKPTFINLSVLKGDESLRPARSFMGLKQDCLNCHTDEHADQLTDRCLDCHSYKAWTPAHEFNHDKARYKLTGKHRETTCVKCHPEKTRTSPFPVGLITQKTSPDSIAQYQGLTFGKCSDCHKDVHLGKLGPDCAGCHTTDGLKSEITEKGFDHNRSKYPLRGKHVKVACNRCHTSGNLTTPVAHNQCKDCHADAHMNQFAQIPDSGACEACHTVEGFSPTLYTLEKHQQSRYPLTGRHLAIPCNRCHTPIKRPNGSPIADFNLKYKDCADCHKDAHQGQVNLWIEKGGCAYCHNTENWHRTSFDHAQARFILDGKHREILCLGCHYIEVDGVGKQVWMKPLTMECAGCHKDVHQSQFLAEGQQSVVCEKCHRTTGWKELRFSHNQDSHFVLDGAHEKVACNACHKQVKVNDELTRLYRPLGTQCVDCHQQKGKAAPQ